MIFIVVGIIAAIFLFILIFSSNISSKDHCNEEVEVSEVADNDVNNYIDDAVYSKSLLMDYEKQYYFKIYEMLPDNVLLHTQVSFSAFLSCSKVRTRNKFNRAHVDMLISDLDFNVLLLVEIDGSSHRAARVKERDKKRDAITGSAGIPTLRIDYSVSDQQIIEAIDFHVLSKLQ